MINKDVASAMRRLVAKREKKLLQNLQDELAAKGYFFRKIEGSMPEPSVEASDEAVAAAIMKALHAARCAATIGFLDVRISEELSGIGPDIRVDRLLANLRLLGFDLTRQPEESPFKPLISAHDLRAGYIPKSSFAEDIISASAFSACDLISALDIDLLGYVLQTLESTLAVHGYSFASGQDVHVVLPKDILVRVGQAILQSRFLYLRPTLVEHSDVLEALVSAEGRQGEAVVWALRIIEALKECGFRITKKTVLDSARVDVEATATNHRVISSSLYKKVSFTILSPLYEKILAVMEAELEHRGYRFSELTAQMKEIPNEIRGHVDMAILDTCILDNSPGITAEQRAKKLYEGVIEGSAEFTSDLIEARAERGMGLIYVGAP